MSVLELLFEFSFLVDKSSATQNVRSISTTFLISLPSPPEDSSMVLKPEMISGVPTSNSQEFCQFYFFSSCIIHIKHHVFIKPEKDSVNVSVFKLGGIHYSSSLVWQLKE